ncbi:glycosyltransferase [Streptomyces boetiae]|uniref:glycosyltransferase n=1 Tax=Streptomyces boetiae TaxID=3075541 RepID=UPI00374E06BF
MCETPETPGTLPTAAAEVDLTVVIPAYNEERRLGRTLDLICRYLRSSPGRHAAWEVIVSDDGSRDGTAAVVEAASREEPRVRRVGGGGHNHGKGHALRLGVLASRGRRVLVMDADLATPVEELAALHERLDAGYAAAVASRAHPGARIEVRQPRLRQALGQAGNVLIRAVAVPGLRDTQCGFKLFEGERARAAFSRSRLDGWGIDVEILRGFGRAGWPVAEVPVRWSHQVGSKVRAVDYLRVLGELARLLTRGPRPADRLVVAGYLALAAVLFGGLWADLDGRYLVDGGQDQTQWEWFFAVTADNVLHLRLGDLLFTTLQNAPLGVNLMANTAMFGLSVPLAPLTAVLGPEVTWAVVLTGGLAATAAAWYWLLLRRFVRSRWAAALGGALCAFGPPMVSHANAHPNFAVLFMMPLIADRAMRLRNGAARDGVLLGLFAAYQVFLGEEALLLAAVGLLLFAVAWAAARPREARAALLPVARGLAVAGGVAALLLAYPLAWQFFGPQSYTGLEHGPTGNSPLAIVEFAGRSLAGDEATADALALNRTEQNAFLGWPLLAFATVVTAWLWRDARARALAFTAAAAVVLSLGRSIPVPGTGVELPGPWRLVDGLPLFESVIESRMAMAAVPALGILVALACDGLAATRDRAVRVAGWSAVAAALVPIVPTPLATDERPPVPAFVADGTWREYLPEGRTLVPVPLPAPHDAAALRWQTVADLGFAVPGGYFVGPAGEERRGVYGPVPRPTAALLRDVADTGLVPEIGEAERERARQDLAFWRAGLLVLSPQPRDAALRVTLRALLGQEERWVGGVWLWEVSRKGS